VDKEKKLTVFSLAWPMFFEHLLRMLLGNVNIIMLGRYSDNAVGAVGVSNQIVMMSLTFFAVISTGSAIVINQYLGAEKQEEAGKSAAAAILINVGLGFVISILVFVFSPTLLVFMNLEGEQLEMGQQFLRIVGATAAIQALTATLSAIIRSYGFVKRTLAIAIVMNIINIIGNYIVIFRPFGIPSYGVTGIAVTRVISEIVGFIIAAVFVMAKLGILKYFSKGLLPEMEMFKKIVRIGAPAAAEGVSWTATQTIITSIIASIGAMALNTRIYVNNVVMYVFVLSMSIGGAGQILAGRLVGAGKKDEVYALCVRNLKIALTSNVTMSIIFMLLRFQLLRIFTSDPEILILGAGIMMIDVIVQTGRAFNHTIPTCLRGAGDVKYPMVVQVISMWFVNIPLCWIIVRFTPFGLYGIWIVFALEECSRGIIMYMRLRSRKWEKVSII